MNSFTMVEENSKFQSLKILQIDGFIFTRFLANNIIMAKENVKFQSFEVVQIDGFSLGFLVNSFTLAVKSFTMVEENFEFQSFKIPLRLSR